MNSRIVLGGIFTWCVILTMQRTPGTSSTGLISSVQQLQKPESNIYLESISLRLSSTQRNSCWRQSFSLCKSTETIVEFCVETYFQISQLKLIDFATMSTKCDLRSGATCCQPQISNDSNLSFDTFLSSVEFDTFSLFVLRVFFNRSSKGSPIALL